MTTRPLDLVSRLSVPPRDFNTIAWVNVGVIVLFFSLLGSRFVLAPGLLMKIDNQAFSLPAAAGVQNIRTASIVVGYRRDDVVMVDGSIVNPTELQDRLNAYARQHPGEVLLLITDRQVSVKALADLSAVASAAGFAYVHVATGSPAANVPAR